MSTHIASRSTFSWHHVPNGNKVNKILSVGIMIGQVLSGQLTKQLIQDLDCSIALNTGVCLGSEYEIWLLKLNGSEHIKVHSFCSKLPTGYVNVPLTLSRVY